jgi:hypothetical protein
MCQLANAVMLELPCISIGKQVTEPMREKGESVEQDLAQHFKGSGRNITVGNVFTDVKNLPLTCSTVS